MTKQKDITKTNLKEIRIAELRAVPIPEDPEKMILEGYAIVFNSAATHYGFTEIIAVGALTGADMKDVPLRYNHNDTWLILARTRNGSLQLTIDDKGLFIRAELIDTQTNRDVYKSIQAGLLDKMSFAFTVPEGGDAWDYENSTRQVLRIDKLYDVSVVDTPFYDNTSIYARALGELDSHREALESAKAEAVERERLKIQIKSKRG